MKTLIKLLTLSIILTLYLNVYGQKEIGISNSSDTTKFKLGNIKILLIKERKNIINIIDSIAKCEKKNKFKGHWGSFDIGFNGFLNNEHTLNLPTKYNFLDLKLNKSISIAFGIFKQNINIYKNHIGLQTGIGFEINNYRFGNTITLFPDSLQIYGYNNSTFNFTKSKLVVNYLTVPLLLEYQTNNKSEKNSFHIGGGIIFGLRVASYTKQVYNKNDNKQILRLHDDFHISPFKYELTARIGWNGMNLFANYAISELFKNNKGPVLHPYTIGCVFFY